jgi:adenylate kinase
MKISDTPLARQVRAIMESGGYVSDEITNEIVKDRLAQSDCDVGFLLDGYPRTLQQVVTRQLPRRDPAAARRRHLTGG